MVENADEYIKFIEEYLDVRLYPYQKVFIKMSFTIEDDIKSKCKMRQIKKSRRRFIK